MKKWIGILALASVAVPHVSGANGHEATTQKIIDEILKRGKSFAELEALTSMGPRLCGSAGAARAVEWTKNKMSSYGLDRVWLQPVKAPVWTRGNHEAATITSTETPVSLNVTALGNSAGTPSGGVEAQVIEVKSLEEAARLGSKLRGKIVFYNRPMDPTLPNPFEAYGRAVDQRSGGPALAAHHGAVGTLVRTMTTLPDDPHPHTGMTQFRGASPIPAAAISTQDANKLSQLLQSENSVRVRLELSAQREPETTSYNVIGEIRGSEIPKEVVIVGGHLDSWDLSPGAHDNASGVVQSIEVLRAFKALNLRPKRTVRAVLFMCEEFGGIGGQEYGKQAQTSGERHILASETDRGGFKALGLSVQDRSNRGLKRIREWAPYFAPLQLTEFKKGSSGTDTEPLASQGVVTLGLIPDPKHYFDFHHSELDVSSSVNPADLASGAATLAIVTYLAAELGI